MNAAGEPVSTIQPSLRRICAAYGADDARFSVFPTFLVASLGGGESVTLELTTPLSSVPRLDQIAALERLAKASESAAITPADGRRRLVEIREMAPRFGPLAALPGYVILTVGICMIIRPAPKDFVVAAIFGAIVGVLRVSSRNQPNLQILIPVFAAFVVSALSALAIKHDLTDPGLRALVASLVVFLPGAALTISVVELACGDLVAGSGRLASGAVQLALLSFGIIAGIETIGTPSSEVFSSSHQVLGSWVSWVGVLVFAIGVVIAYSAPLRSFPWLVLVLYAGWTGQVVGDHLLGGLLSGFVGAITLTLTAFVVARAPSALPVFATFLPGFWLLVPGALSLIGITQLAGNPTEIGSQNLLAAVGSILAVALGVLVGMQLLEWLRGLARAAPSPPR